MSRNKLYFFIPIVLIILFFTFILSCTSSNSSTSESSVELLEHKLAVINAGGFVEEDDITVIEFRRLLTELEKKVVNSRQDISDISVKTQEILRDEGYNISLIQIMRDLNNSIPEGSEGFKLEEIAAAYIVLIKQ